VLVDDKNNIELITNDLVGGNYVWWYWFKKLKSWRYDK
jgi:hypothetical protein